MKNSREIKTTSHATYRCQYQLNYYWLADMKSTIEDWSGRSYRRIRMSNLEKVYLTIREGETTSNLIMFKKSGVKSVRSEFKNWDVVLIQLSIIYRDRISDWSSTENRIFCTQNVVHAQHT